MKKVRSVLIALLVCFLLLTSISIAAGSQADTPKKNIGFIIINEKTSGIKQKQFDELVITPVSQILCNRYQISSEPEYYNKLKDAGYRSVPDGDSGNIVDILKAENLDYAVVIETLPAKITNSNSDSWVRWTFQARMKIIDLEANKTLYSGKFMSKDQVKRMADKMVHVINKKLEGT